QVDDLVIVAAQNDADDVLADVVDVAANRGDYQLAARFVHRPGFQTFRFHERQQVRHRLFHDAGTLYDLRQKHLARAEQIADDVHAVHERTFDELERPFVQVPGFLHILVDEIRDAIDEGMGKAFGDRGVAPARTGGDG